MLFDWIWERDKRRCSDCIYKGEQCLIWKEPYISETTQTGFDKNLAAKQCCDFMPKEVVITRIYRRFMRRRVDTMPKPDISKVIPKLARQALEFAKGDRKAAFSRYIELHYRNTGRLAPGCDNKDLQAFYEKEVEHDG